MVMTELDDDNAAAAAAGIDDDGDDKVDLVSGTQSPTALQHSGICIIGVLRPVISGRSTFRWKCKKKKKKTKERK